MEEKLVAVINENGRGFEYCTVKKITGSYLVSYQKINNCSKVTVDNVRRNLSYHLSPKSTNQKLHK